jgi:hypothetical protein
VIKLCAAGVALKSDHALWRCRSARATVKFYTAAVAQIHWETAWTTTRLADTCFTPWPVALWVDATGSDALSTDGEYAVAVRDWP